MDGRARSARPGNPGANDLRRRGPDLIDPSGGQLPRPHRQSLTMLIFVTATYTFDVFTTLDGYGSYGPNGDWGGYWGKQGPEFLDRRLALYGEKQRMVLGANTFRQFVELMGPTSGVLQELDPVNAQLRSMPTKVVSTTLPEP